MQSSTPDTKAKADTSARAADVVIEAIEADIHAGLIKDGETLPTERDLMKRFDVSRTVIREAIKSLSSSGLVATRPRYRPVVRKPSVDSALQAVEGIAHHLLTQPGGVRNFFETRILIEAGLAREAAVNATKDDINALKYALDQNEATINSREAFHQSDMAFHRVLYQIGDNPVLPAIHTAYTSWLGPQWSQMPRSRERNQDNFEAHSAIFEAILMRDPEAAEAALKSHLNKAWEQVRETFGL